MKQIIISVLVLSNLMALGQTVPSAAGGPSSGSAWSRGGNTQGNNANILQPLGILQYIGTQMAMLVELLISSTVQE